MGRFVDSIIAYRVLRMLVTPFDQTDAFKLGIVDARGKELKKMRQLNTVAEQNAYTILHRMVFRLKRIIEKVPLENKKLLSFAAALSLIKEHNDTKSEPIDLEDQFLEKLKVVDTLKEDITLTNKFFTTRQIVPFKLFIEEAPANNAAATPGIEGFTPDTLGIKVGKRKPKILKRNEVKNV